MNYSTSSVLAEAKLDTAGEESQHDAEANIQTLKFTINYLKHYHDLLLKVNFE